MGIAARRTSYDKRETHAVKEFLSIKI